ncbi:MAG: hypothetical protein JNJ78_26325, partial [Anaerolineae bacterium]|nr:hypothetical protein [Anaerolineae bacterium]
MGTQTAISELSSSDAVWIDQVMAYRQLVRDVRSTGWWNILWGGLTLWLGIDGFGVWFGDPVQVIFGVLAGAKRVGDSTTFIKESAAIGGTVPVCGDLEHRISGSGWLYRIE